MKRRRICFIATVPMAINAFLLEHIKSLSFDHDVYVISNFSTEKILNVNGVTCINVPLAREISLGVDIRALFELFSIFRRNKFDLIHSVTPKAGLLSMIAGLFAQINNRVHWFTGQVWVTKTGLSRRILKFADKVIAICSTDLLADSPSQRDFLVKERVCDYKKINVIGDGSICGVDEERFSPNPNARLMIRVQHGIPEDAKVVLFLGRLNPDKGINELATAMQLISEHFSELHWLIVGPDEGNMLPDLRLRCAAFIDRVHFKGFTREPEKYMAAADIFCLPSYREGFGSSVLEAAAVGVPAVASKIYGLTDAVDEGVTGLLVPPANAVALAAALETLLNDEEMQLAMGANARARALLLFSRRKVVEGLIEYYQEIFSRVGRK